MSDFNPTLENEVDLERSILDLKTKKAGYVGSKTQLQLDVANIKDILNNPNSTEYETKEATNMRVVTRNTLSQLEHQIKAVNLEIISKRKLLIAIASHLRNNKKQIKSDDKMINQLITLKEKYAAFASDNTRISSMRLMASQLTEELESIIKT